LWFDAPADLLACGAWEQLVAALVQPAPRMWTRAKARHTIEAVVPARALRLVPPRVNASDRLVCLRAYVASRTAAILHDDARRGG
jgi:hypothetical protein